VTNIRDDRLNLEDECNSGRNMMSLAGARAVMRVGISMTITVACLFLASMGHAGASTDPWCEINPPHPRTGPSVEIPTTDVHVVRREQQSRAKNLLQGKPFVHLTRKEASDFVKDPSLLVAEGGGEFYLVRASAFYVNDQFDIRSNLRVYAFPNDHALEVVNSSLSQPGTEPVNLGVVVRVGFKVREIGVICLTAS
jgi:hypothetical protein